VSRLEEIVREAVREVDAETCGRMSPLGLAFVAGVRAVEAAARECAGAECEGCREGLPRVETGLPWDGLRWQHFEEYTLPGSVCGTFPPIADATWTDCRAAAIRALFPTVFEEGER
jgi:hypothetical protein